MKKNSIPVNHFKRRDFIRKAAVMTIAGTSPLIVGSCKQGNKPENASADETRREENGKTESISPPEDLMREHGVLNRILLIYEDFISKLNAQDDFDPASLKDAAGIIRHFIEDYHEMLEEQYLFTRFRKAGVLTDLVNTLSIQHAAGRNLTEQIIGYGNMGMINTQDEKVKLAGLLTEFIRMYRPHEAREDTVLFPKLRDIVSPSEFDALGEDFEKKEHKMFGEDGFMNMVDRVAQIEMKLGIHDLSRFTP